jgi:hypothetical protein
VQQDQLVQLGQLVLKAQLVLLVLQEQQVMIQNKALSHSKYSVKEQ